MCQAVCVIPQPLSPLSLQYQMLAWIGQFFVFLALPIIGNHVYNLDLIYLPIAYVLKVGWLSYDRENWHHIDLGGQKLGRHWIWFFKVH